MWLVWYVIETIIWHRSQQYLLKIIHWLAFCTLQRLNSSNSSELVETDSRILQTPSAVLLLPPQSGERPICFFLNRSALSELVEGNQAGGGRGQQGSPWQPGQQGNQGNQAHHCQSRQLICQPVQSLTWRELETLGGVSFPFWYCSIYTFSIPLSMSSSSCLLFLQLLSAGQRWTCPTLRKNGVTSEATTWVRYAYSTRYRGPIYGYACRVVTFQLWTFWSNLKLFGNNFEEYWLEHGRRELDICILFHARKTTVHRS